MCNGYGLEICKLKLTEKSNTTDQKKNSDFDGCSCSLIHYFKIMDSSERKKSKVKELEIEKSKAMIIVEIIEYVPDSVVIKTIIKKSTGNITAVSFDTGEKLEERTSPFDNYIQIIDGKAEIIIDGDSKLLECGESIIVPAHAATSIKANSRFKMISTVIKSGYEDVS